MDNCQFVTLHPAVQITIIIVAALCFILALAMVR